MKGTVCIGGYKMLDYKKLTRDKQVLNLLAKEELTFPIINEKSEILVKKGDKVLVGQVLSQNIDSKLPYIISSISGIVKAIEERLIESGEKVKTFVVENDNEYVCVKDYGKVDDYKNLSKQEILDKIKKSGLYSKSFKKKTSKIIINAIEEDIYSTSNYALILEDPKKVIDGAEILLKIYDNPQIHIIINKDLADIGNDLQRQTTNQQITIKQVKVNYPMQDKLLSKKDDTIIDISTLIGIYDAVVLGIPYIEKIVTVTGQGVKDALNIKARIGTKYKDLILAAGGLLDNTYKLVSGSIMKGHAIISTDISITKDTSSIICLLKNSNQGEETACIRCSKCHSVCPKSLMPQRLSSFVSMANKEGFIKYGGLECSQCGNCTFICPAKIKLSQSIQLGISSWDEK